MRETILTNARLALGDTLCHGTLVLRGGTIAEVAEGRSHVPAAHDLEGDLLVPGLIDLHTDNLERQVQPRINARWPSRSALLAHDAQCAAAGITTVFDALCVGDLGFDAGRGQTFRDGVADLDALGPTGLLRSEHFLHLRCEMPAANVLDLLDHVIDHPRVRLASLMDHSPGVGQYADIERFRLLRRKEGMSEAAIDAKIAALQAQRGELRDANRRTLLARLVPRGIALASHDDRDEAEVAENVADGIRISEFPVTCAAAAAAKARGMDVIAGAPNIVRGGSHSGNVAVADLIAAGTVDALASDYVPASLLEAAFRGAASGLIELAPAIALVSEAPARLVGLSDRGRIAPDLRADLVRVRPFDDLPAVREVWRTGERVA